jgi:hypothetical protein
MSVRELRAPQAEAAVVGKWQADYPDPRLANLRPWAVSSRSMTSQLRDDVRQCLIVAPGGLVEQWQDELFFKFGLRFDLLTNQLVDANVNLNVFGSP